MAQDANAETAIDNNYQNLEAIQHLLVSRTLAALAILSVVSLVISAYFMGFSHPLVFNWGALLLAFAGLYGAVLFGISIQLPARIMLGVLLLGVASLSILSGGLSGSTLILTCLIPPLSALLLNKRTGWIYTALCIALIGGLAYLNVTNFTFPAAPPSETQMFIMNGVMLVATLILLNITTGHYVQLRNSLLQTVQAAATHDHLTGIVNRQVIEDVLERESKRSQRNETWLSLMILDVDDFKRYNDINGHHQGDRCLQAIAQQLENALNRPADMVGRFSGEEFIVLLPETPPDGAEHIAKILCRKISQLQIRYTDAEPDIVTMTVGVASANGPEAVSSEQLISMAEEALNHGKSQGSDRIVRADSLLTLESGS
ncbi:MAG: diguanylate cyclase [Pseudomonadota bacterium]